MVQNRVRVGPRAYNRYARNWRACEDKLNIVHPANLLSPYNMGSRPCIIITVKEDILNVLFHKVLQFRRQNTKRREI